MIPGSTKELLHKGWGSPRPPHKDVVAAPHQVGGSMTCRQATNAPRGRHTEIFLWFTLEPAHKVQHLAISLTKELTFTQHSQSVLRTKDMNTKLLDGLEIFLGVFETCSNSSKLQMVGGWHIYRLSSQTSRLEPLPNFLRMHRCIRRCSTGASGHTESQDIRWEL